MLKNIAFFFLGAFVGGIATYLLSTNKTEVLSPVDVTEDTVHAVVSEYQGIDVSNHQGKITWSEVAQDKNIKFVYIKASEGATYQDKRYKENVKGEWHPCRFISLSQKHQSYSKTI